MRVMVMLRAAPARARADNEELTGLARSSPGKHVLSVGYELEGGMDRSELQRLEEYVKRLGLSNYYERDTEKLLHIVGKEEPELELKLWSTNFGTLVGFLHYAYEECKLTTNVHCGFHVHMTFEDMPGAVSFFSSMEVQQEFRQAYADRFEDTERYMARLYGRWCGHTSIDDRFKPKKWKGTRLLPFNKLSTIDLDAYRVHGTIEFRVLPNQESADEAASSLDWIVSTVDRIYDSHGGVSSTAIVTPQMVERDRALHEAYRRIASG